jgi:hypothetical protein
MHYIMVTDWEDHWDRMQNRTTTYTRGMLKSGAWGKWVENMDTIFIRHHKDSSLVDSWIGTVSDFVAGKPMHGDKETVRFRVTLRAKCEIPPNYANLESGWYLVEGDTHSLNLVSASRVMFEPPFVARLKTTSDWREFEYFTYYLLRLLGIHSIRPVLSGQQQGRPDGVFKLRSLAVVYDCTLESDYGEKKRDQIANYCAMLRKGTIDVAGVTMNVADCSKQVWIITRGCSREICRVDDILVREVTIDAILDVYHDRMSPDMDEDGLADSLKRTSKQGRQPRRVRGADEGG